MSKKTKLTDTRMTAEEETQRSEPKYLRMVARDYAIEGRIATSKDYLAAAKRIEKLTNEVFCLKRTLQRPTVDEDIPF